jgi:hypothetical protein
MSFSTCGCHHGVAIWRSDVSGTCKISTNGTEYQSDDSREMSITCGTNENQSKIQLSADNFRVFICSPKYSSESFIGNQFFVMLKNGMCSNYILIDDSSNTFTPSTFLMTSSLRKMMKLPPSRHPISSLYRHWQAIWGIHPLPTHTTL